MQNMKAEAIELLQGIPDEKLTPVVEILKGLRLLYLQNKSAVTHEPAPVKAMGIFNKYADVDLIPMEKDAWGKAVKEKYAVN